MTSLWARYRNKSKILLLVFMIFMTLWSGDNCRSYVHNWKTGRGLLLGRPEVDSYEGAGFPTSEKGGRKGKNVHWSLHLWLVTKTQKRHSELGDHPFLRRGSGMELPLPPEILRHRWRNCKASLAVRTYSWTNIVYRLSLLRHYARRMNIKPRIRIIIRN